MTIMFRIATAAEDEAPAPAALSPDAVAALRALLRDEGERRGLALLDTDEVEVPKARFEARVCPLALAALARAIDFDPAAIAVLEEAQFRARRVTFRRRSGSPWWTLEVALTSDQGVELDLASGNAYALLESLGLAPDSVGEADVGEVRRRLANPAVQRRMHEQNVAGYADRLERLLASAEHDASSRFEWA